MDNEKMAQFIAERRKLKKLTQKQLADKLGVTDKAVSKWERGLSCPDILLLTKLAEILGVSISELLSGENTESSNVDDVDAIVETTLLYSDNVTKRKTKHISSTLAGIITSLSILGILVCSICNLAINGKITWAWFSISSIIYFWLVVIPIVLWTKKGIFISLISISLLTIPFLLVLETIIGIKGLIMPLGIPIFIMSIIYLWVVYLLIIKVKWSKCITSGLACLAGIPLSFGINYIISKQLNESIIDIWDIFIYFLLIVIATFLLVFGFSYNKFSRESE